MNTPQTPAGLSRFRHLLLWILLIGSIADRASGQEYVFKDLYVLTPPAGSGPGLSLPGQGTIALGECVGSTAGGVPHALVWSPPGGDVVDAHPSFFTSSALSATDGRQQVGYGYVGESDLHAALWEGTAGSAVDLHPTNLTFSQAYGVFSGEQVGTGGTGTLTTTEHALLWHGSAASVVDLNPAGFTSSAVYGTDGAQQVGSGVLSDGSGHAVLWTGTADSAVDLHLDTLPSGFFNSSTALGVGGGQQVGQLVRGGMAPTGHAALWTGSADSEVDLQPADAINSIALATNGEVQVGHSFGGQPLAQHAMLWKGTAESALDLHDFLPAGFTDSAAHSIDAAGNIYGIASNDSDGTVHAVEWLTQAARLANISTRAEVGTEDDVLIAGFIVSGTQAKPILIRGLGPSLTEFDLPSVLADPILELHDSTGAIVRTNDDWKDTQQEAIAATGLAPTEDAEAAMLAALAPGAYTVILQGADQGVGHGLVDFYDLDSGVDSRLLNISTRGKVLTGDSVLIGGFVVGGAEDGQVLIRALGPTLTSLGLNDALSDPVLDLHNEAGDILLSNDNWADSQQAEIEATGLQPVNPSESAILTTLAPGNYTAIVRGSGDVTGTALIEVYKVNAAP